MSIAQIKVALAKAYDAFIVELKAQHASVQTLILGKNQQAIKDVLTAHVNTHVTLDPSVSPELGCAEAVSFVLRTAGVPDVPPSGFPGTSALYQALLQSKNFILVTEPLPYDVVISPTGTSVKNSPHGHTGIVGENGLIYSNSSDTGLLSQNYTLTTWKQYFGDIEGFPAYYFRWV